MIAAILTRGFAFFAILALVQPHRASAVEDLFTISVDWEGAHLKEENLSAIRNFRAKYPNTKMVHFLNAAYYTKPGANAAKVTAAIRSVLRPGDEIGLHIHTWDHLTDAAGVKFRSSPTFWGEPKLTRYDGCYGLEVCMNAYTLREIRLLIRKSLEVLAQNGFTGIRSFRAGGWLASADVWEAMALEGLIIDSSAVPTVLLELIAERPVIHTLRQLWRGVTPYAEPYYQVTTRSGATLTEFPDNLALADYIDGQTAFRIYRIRTLGDTDGEGVNVHYGFHQENAKHFLDRVDKWMQLMGIHAYVNSRKLRSVTLSEQLDVDSDISCEAKLLSEK